MSYRPMVYVQGLWCGNGLRFATEKEAANNAHNLAERWILVEAYRVDESADPVNYVYSNGALVPVGKD